MKHDETATSPGGLLESVGSIVSSLQSLVKPRRRTVVHYVPCGKGVPQSVSKDYQDGTRDRWTL